MLDEVKILQSEKVNALIDIYKSNKKNIVFKAPTGSGKTHMMAELCDKIIENEKNTVFIISSLSKGNIAIQNYEQFSEYQSKGEFKNINPFLITSETSGEGKIYIPEFCNAYFLPRDLYKKNAKLMEGPMLSFLETLKSNKKKIVVIKDECHIDFKNLDALNNYFDCVFNFSATPNLGRGQFPDVEIKKEEAINIHLIKEVCHQEYCSDDEHESLVKALEKFNSIKVQYRNKLNINPCMIIQISNKELADDEFELVLDCLREYPNLQYVLLLQDNKKFQTNSDVYKRMNKDLWADELKKNISEIDVIIFKMVISEGWNIPRACMLYQIRDVKSEQLNEQVIGRVCRNPRLIDYETLNDEQKELCNYAYVWGVDEAKEREFAAVQLKGTEALIKRDVQIETTELHGLSKKGFDLENYLNNQPESPSTPDIFSLGKEINNAPNDIVKMLYEYSVSYEKWFKAAKNISSIIKMNNDCLHDYEHNLVCKKEKATFSSSSYFEITGQYAQLNNFVWERTDGSDEFHFDSEAEKEWAKKLCSLETLIKNGTPTLLGNEGDVKLWGKNFYPNSKISFDYYSFGIHKSYPDFVMIDSNNRIHLFECKSLNKSGDNNCSFDTQAYKDKINEIKEAYKQASKITTQLFYLPIKNGREWDIIRYQNGVESHLTFDQFKTSLSE